MTINFGRSLQEGFLLTAEKLRGVLTDRTRMLIFCNPSNPTGAVHSKVREQTMRLKERALCCYSIACSEKDMRLLAFFNAPTVQALFNMNTLKISS